MTFVLFLVVFPCGSSLNRCLSSMSPLQNFLLSNTKAWIQYSCPPVHALPFSASGFPMCFPFSVETKIDEHDKKSLMTMVNARQQTRFIKLLSLHRSVVKLKLWLLIYCIYFMLCVYNTWMRMYFEKVMAIYYRFQCRQKNIKRWAFLSHWLDGNLLASPRWRMVITHTQRIKLT